MSEPSAGVRHEVFGPSPARELAALLRSGSVRPLGRLLAAGAWTAGGLMTLLSGMAVLMAWPRGRQRWRHRVVRWWARGLGWIVGMRVTIEGPAPSRPFFLVANHLSYVDIVLLYSRLDGVFVAKRELVDWPVLGYLTRLVGTIFVDRRRRRDAVRVLRAIAAGIERGEGVILFPEGTSTAGDGVHPLRPALFEWAARARYPVHAATIRYETPPGHPPAREAVCWWGSMAFVPHLLTLVRLPGFRAVVRFADAPLVGADRVELATRARELIAAGLRPSPSAVEQA